MDVMFDSESLVVISLAVTYLIQGHSLPFKLIQDIGKMQQMYRFGIDVMFHSGKFEVTSSQGQGHHAKVKGWRAKIIV